jgi:hypothetical protein
VILVQSHAILGSNSVHFFYFSTFKLFMQQLSAKFRLLVNFQTFSTFWLLFGLFGLVQAHTSQKFIAGLPMRKVKDSKMGQQLLGPWTCRESVCVDAR